MLEVKLNPIVNFHLTLTNNTQANFHKVKLNHIRLMLDYTSQVETKETNNLNKNNKEETLMDIVLMLIQQTHISKNRM